MQLVTASNKMCLNPLEIATPDTGELVTVSCRQCWQCRDRHVADWVGRLLAEKQAATQCLAVTLTYRDSLDVRSAVLTYPDIQKFFKRLRFHGQKVRYFVAGEYGDLKGRAHWHCILFVTGQPFRVPLDENYEWSAWPDGFSFFQEPSSAGLRYVVKYALKDWADGNAARSVMMSKKPPIGDGFFGQLVGRVHDAALPPSQFYTVLGGVRRDGRLTEYRLRGRSWTLFLERYAALCGVSVPDVRDGMEYFKDTPMPVVVREYLDKLDAKAPKNGWDDPQFLLGVHEKAGRRDTTVERLSGCDHFKFLDEELTFCEALRFVDIDLTGGACLRLWSDDVLYFYVDGGDTADETSKPWVLASLEGLKEWLNVIAAVNGTPYLHELWRLEIVSALQDLPPLSVRHGLRYKASSRRARDFLLTERRQFWME